MNQGLVVIALIFKYVGAGITVFLGIHGICHNYKSKQDGQTEETLTGQGRKAIKMLIIAGSITILASVFEDITKHIENEQAEDQAKKQRQENLAQFDILSEPTKLIPSYVRMKVYFQTWETVLAKTLSPSPLRMPEIEIENANLLTNIPKPVLQNLQSNVDAVITLINRGEAGDSKIFAGLFKYAKHIESVAFSPRVQNIEIESAIEQYYRASTADEARLKARKTVGAVIRVLDVAYQRDREGATMSDSWFNEWDRVGADLKDLELIWSFTGSTNTSPEIQFSFTK